MLCLPVNKRVAKLQTIALDPNGFPYGHDDATWAAAAALASWLNELPDTNSFTSADVEEGAERMLSAYRHSLERSLKQLWDRR